MLASTSTSSTTLLTHSTSEGLQHLYRTLLQQARLLSLTLDDPIVYTSHRYLARKTLEPLLLSPATETSSAKRIRRAQIHRRHLADANFGWEHSVFRALSIAYARRGKLRRDALSDLSPVPSCAESEERYPPNLRRKDFSPALQTLLTSSASINGAPVKSKEWLMGRPPPPFLPSRDDALVRVFGKAQGRRRISNARRKFVRVYMRKISLPLGGADGELVRHLEAKAGATLEGGGGERGKDRARPYLGRALEGVNQYRSDLNASAHRKRALRTQGWSSHPKDFSKERRRTRLYARLLDDVPLLLLDSNSTQGERRERKNDPLGVRSMLDSVRDARFKVVKSRLAVGPKMRGAEVAPRRDAGGQEVGKGLHESEVRFLRGLGLL